MNERIRELWDRSKTSGVHPEFGEYDKYSAEKFAELIVRECAGITLDYKNDDYYNGWCDHSAEILEHFGVK